MDFTGEDLQLDCVELNKGAKHLHSQYAVNKVSEAHVDGFQVDISVISVPELASNAGPSSL